MKILHLAALSAIALAGFASAATSVIYTYQTISNSTDTSWVSPTGSASVVALNMGSNTATTTFGGVSWLTTYANEAKNYDTAISMNFHAPGKAWASNNSGFYSLSDASSILTTANYAYGDAGNRAQIDGVDYRIDLNGFTVGQEYLVQFVVADNRGYPDRTITIDGYSANIAAQDSTAYQYSYAAGDSKYAVVTARFTPAAGDTDFSFRPLVDGGTNGLQVNAIQVLTIPEPSAALLGGLGMLVLLRRRR